VDGSKDLDHFYKIATRVCDSIEQYLHIIMLIRGKNGVLNFTIVNILWTILWNHTTLKIMIRRSDITVTYLWSRVAELIEAENLPLSSFVLSPVDILCNRNYIVDRFDTSITWNWTRYVRNARSSNIERAALMIRAQVYWCISYRCLSYCAAWFGEI